MRSSPSPEKEKKDRDKERENAFLAAKASYLFSKEQEAELSPKLKEKGYTACWVSEELLNEKDTQYRCVVFINPTTKHVLFANAGTNVTKLGIRSTASNMVNNAYLTAGKIPPKFHHAQKLNEEVLEGLKKLDENPQIQTGDGEWRFEYTGHGLGAVISRMQAIDMQMKIDDKPTLGSEYSKRISVKLFDSPAYSQVIKNLVKRHKETHDLQGILKSQDCEVFQARPNLINAVGEDKMLALKDGVVYEALHLEGKKDIYDKFLEFKVGKNVWKSIKKVVLKFIHKHGVKGAVALGGVIGTVITPGIGSGVGAGAGLVIGGILQQIVKKEIKKELDKLTHSEGFQTTIQTASDMPHNLGVTIKSHDLDNFIGVSGADNIALIKLENPHNDPDIPKLGVTGARLMEYNEKLFQEIQKCDSNYQKVVDTTDLKAVKSLKNYSMCRKKYFMRSPDGKLLRCSRGALINAMKEVKKQESAQERSQEPQQKLEQERRHSYDGPVPMDVDSVELLVQQTPREQGRELPVRKSVMERDPSNLIDYRKDRQKKRQEDSRKRKLKETRVSQSPSLQTPVTVIRFGPEDFTLPESPLSTPPFQFGEGTVNHVQMPSERVSFAFPQQKERQKTPSKKTVDKRKSREGELGQRKKAKSWRGKERKKSASAATAVAIWGR